jgi:hypothetical protein
VSRHGRRSIATTLNPALVIDSAMIDPVQPKPIMAMPVAGNFVAIRLTPSIIVTVAET